MFTANWSAQTTPAIPGQGRSQQQNETDTVLKAEAKELGFPNTL